MKGSNSLFASIERLWISFLSRCQSVLFRCSTNKKFRDITNIYKWMWKRECYLHSLLCMSSRLEMSFSRYKVQDTRRKIITDLKMNYIVRKIFMPLVHWNIILVAEKSTENEHSARDEGNLLFKPGLIFVNHFLSHFYLK